MKNLATKFIRMSTITVPTFCGCSPAVLVSISLGIGVLAIATHWGIGLYPDSIVYIGTARNILNGAGVTFLNDVGEVAPVTQYPPLYSSMIAAFGALGLDPLDGARWISILFYAANGLLAAHLVYRITSCRSASWCACFLSLSAFPMIYIHSQALTEPIFIFLVLLALLRLAQFLETGRASELYSASLIIGMSCLVRYVGIAVLATGGAAILCLSASRLPQRLSAAAKFLIVGSLPLAGWVLRNLLTAGNAVNRTFGIHPPGLADLLPALDTAGYWLLPISLVEDIPWLSRTVIGIASLSVCYLLLKSRLLRSRYVHLLIFWLFGYASFLLVSMSLNDQPLYFDTRTLALPYMASMILAIAALSDWLAVRQEQKSARLVSVRPWLAIALSVQMINGIVWLKQSYVDGIGFATGTWRASELINFVKHAREPLLIFSNAPDFVATLTGKPAHMIPRKVDPNNYWPNDRYLWEIEAMREQLKQPNAVVLYFDDNGGSRLWYLPSSGELETKTPLKLIRSAPDGKIYRLESVSQAAQP